MEAFIIKNLNFTYPTKNEPALRDVNLVVLPGEFVTICGKSGCGKSTLLRNLKTVLSPHGTRTGEVLFYGRPLAGVDLREQTKRIGYVLQNPDNQIVTDKVWHELAFGLESLGFDTRTIRLRVAEMASFFGIQGWFMQSVSELSGGQKQLLNLASVMAMQPDVLILDEPTSQLDPIAASEFLETVKRINREIGTTVIMTEHRLEEILPMSDRAVVLDKGGVLVDSTPHQVGAELAKQKHDMFTAMPSPMQVYASLTKSQGEGGSLPKELVLDSKCPITVRDGRNWLTHIFAGSKTVQASVPDEKEGLIASCEEGRRTGESPAVELEEVWFRYGQRNPDVIKDLSMKVPKGRLFCMVGGNGTGKTTALKLISGINKPVRGKVLLKGKEISKYKKNELFNGILGVLPQNPQSIFVEKSVELDLMEMLDGKQLTIEEKSAKVRAVAELVEIDGLLSQHPYDLSGGEQQRAALGKVLLLEPEILLLDEPTKGLDSHFKAKLAGILGKLTDGGVTIVMVSHDIEFCGKYGDLCAMFFDGSVVSVNTPNKFFSGNSFYTTAANRMSRHIFDNAVTTKDVIDLCSRNLKL